MNLYSCSKISANNKIMRLLLYKNKTRNKFKNKIKNKYKNKTRIKFNKKTRI